MSLFLNTKLKIRKNFIKNIDLLKIPDLLSIQKESFNKFIGNLKKVNNIIYKKKSGIENIFNSIFPIKSNNNNIILNYNNYILEKNIFSVEECINKGLTYSSSLKCEFSLYENINNKYKFIKKQLIYICEIPIITSSCSFIINGIERVIVSQLHRSPGIFFDIDKDKSNLYNKNIYVSKIIPYRGSWIDFEFDSKDNIFIRIDKKKKIPITLLLHCFKFSNEKILEIFYKKEIILIDNNKFRIKLDYNNLIGLSFNFDININDNLFINKGKIISNLDLNNIIKNNIKYIEVKKNYILNKILAKDYYDINNNLLFRSNQIINSNVFDTIINNNINNIEILHTDYIDNNYYISNTMKIDSTYDYKDSILELFKIIKPGELSNFELAENLFKNIFLSENKYNLSKIGRLKLNTSLNIKNNKYSNLLTINDILLIIKKLIKIKNNKDYVDDIDNLGNRRVKLVGEMIENQLKIGLIKTEKFIKDKLSTTNNINLLNIQEIINSKQIISVIKEFFNSNQLSQFMDQNNILSEITHKRRISSLGQGGLIRERAGFEIRDVHFTHYGRLCPIETPEGPNIGLINSLSIYSKVNKYGFLETPYLLINNGKLTNKIHYLSSIEENNYIIAQLSNKFINNKNIIDDLILCRYKGEFKLFNKNLINYMDVSSQQIVSIGSSLIPFLEHDDANRALMGANMQRQAIPTIKPDSPIIGTGMEKIVAIDSGSLLIAKRGGKIIYIDYDYIIIKVNSNEIDKNNNSYIDTYKLKKFNKSNQNTCINNRIIVSLNENVNKNDILADGSSTNIGELALGQNVRVAFMSWNGYNFEDSILISEKLIQNNKFNSINIQEYVCISRDTKLGSEEITYDIPNINSLYLSKLDESGIVYIGAYVNENDVLVGKITPKGETQLSPEEKLLRAIFGEKASNVKDSSLKVPNGISGKVIDVKIFTKEGVKKDKRTLDIENSLIEKEKLKLLEEKNIIKSIIIEKINTLLLKNNIKDNLLLINVKYININLFEKYYIKDSDYKIITELINKFNNLDIEYENKFIVLSSKIKKGEELSPGILKIIKVYIAIKRQIQVGDKISGRHGNKGVISKICPIEDMPYDSDGNTIDIILNPLGVPSRMNIGQILEAHLGFAAKKIGENIEKMLNKKINLNKIRKYINDINRIGQIDNSLNIDNISDTNILEIANKLKNGLYISTPVFNGISEKEIKEMFKLANIPKSGQIELFDGCTGKKFDRKITVGYIYIMKLNHLVDDKIHARSTGSYSLITQQPLGGKSQFGGQRFGEMEVWALEAYGAAYTLQEMLTIKSDDVIGRINMYKNIINNNYNIKSNIPESFNVLLKEIKSLCINIELCE